jgi:hypothetical protein
MAAFQEQVDSWNRDHRISQQQLGGDHQSMENWDSSTTRAFDMSTLMWQITKHLMDP